MANGLIDVIRQRRLMMYPSDELRAAATQAVLIESSRGLRLGKSKQSNRVDAIVALAMAVTAALQRKGYGAMRAYEFGSDPYEALLEIVGIHRPPDDLPSFDVGFTYRDGTPLPRTE
jgi:hypothetical protein